MADAAMPLAILLPMIASAIVVELIFVFTVFAIFIFRHSLISASFQLSFDN